MKMEEKSFVSTSVFMALDLTYHYLSKFDSWLPGLCGGLCINSKGRILLTHVDFHGTQGVDRETLIGINGNAEESRVGIDQFILVPDHTVPENASIIEISQTSHILRAIKFGRIDLSYHILLENFRLKIEKKIYAYWK